jgi:hypothetical protein
MRFVLGTSGPIAHRIGFWYWGNSSLGYVALCHLFY